jgi:hypothetical protein
VNAETYPYSHGRHLIIAGCLALVTLTTAVVYACHATPYTMVLFLGVGSSLLIAAILIFGWTIWKDLRSRLESIVTRQFTAGEVIYSQGDPPEHVFFITKGQVEVVYKDPLKGEVILGRLGRDDYFGETSVLSRLPRQATARAVDTVEVLAIHRTDFLRVYNSLPRLRSRIEAQQARRRALVESAKSAS